MISIPEDTRLVLRQWQGRPDAALNGVGDVCGPASRATNRSMLPGLTDALDAGFVERARDGLRLTAIGREALAAIIADEHPDDAYDPASLRVLVGLEPPRRQAGDPVVRWAEEFLGLPAGDAGDPGGVPGRAPEPPGEPVKQGG